nr:hypothetical protein MFLOJ_55350 [Mycobacterium florentinum]
MTCSTPSDRNTTINDRADAPIAIGAVPNCRLGQDPQRAERPKRPHRDRPHPEAATERRDDAGEILLGVDGRPVGRRTARLMQRIYSYFHTRLRHTDLARRRKAS